MQFSALFLTALASAQAAFAVSGSEEFGLLAIHSGSVLQYANLIAKEIRSLIQRRHLRLCGNRWSFQKGPRGDAMPGFMIKDGGLEYNNQGFVGVKDRDHYRVSSKSNSDDSIGVRIRAVDLEDAGAMIPDYTPDGKDCWALGPLTSFTAAPTG